jgi:hypothetical protein
MAIDFMEFLKGTFENVEGLNLEQVRKLVQETNAYFASLENTIEFGDPKSREKAVAAALEIKEFLDSKVNQAGPLPNLDTLNDEERGIVDELTLGMKLQKSAKNDNKIKKLKPIKLS